MASATAHQPGSKPTLKAKVQWTKIPETMAEMGTRWASVEQRWRLYQGVYKMWGGGRGAWAEEEGEKLLQITLYRAWWEHFLCSQLWDILACVVKEAFFFVCFLTLPELKASFQAWLFISASTSNMREMPSRRFLYQLLPPQQTASMWRLNSQRYWRKHLLPTFLCKTCIYMNVSFLLSCH